MTILNQHIIFKHIALIVFVLLVEKGISQSFTKITNDPCVNTATQSYGSSFIDFDNDGDLDLFVANFTNSTNELFLNNGNGTFVANNSYTFTSTNGSSLGHSWIDFDNDCDLDLFISNGGVNGSQINRLYVNNNGIYSIAGNSTIPNTTQNSQTSNWGDYDNDGDLDLFICNMSSQNNFLIENNNGILSLNTSINIANDGGTSNDANWVDYDNDGDLDLFVANSNNEKNFLYKNNGNGSFTKIVTGAIVNDYGTSLGSCWGDYDNDGFLDVYICNAYSPNFLYHNNGNGTFTKITTGSLVTDNTYSYGASWVDYDNDGDLDIYVTNSNGQNNCLYKNNGNATFTKITTGDIVNDGGVSRSTSWGDIDNDGDLDCYVTNRSYAHNNLYINQSSPQNYWIKILLKGIITNYDAIGCTVRAKATINNNPVWQMRHVSSKAGYCSQNSPEVEFGFGSTSIIDSLMIYWPASGTTCVYTNVQTNQSLIYYETCTNLNSYTLYDTLCKGNNYYIKPGAALYDWYSDSLGNNLINTDSSFTLTNIQHDTSIFFNFHNYDCGEISKVSITIIGNAFQLDIGNDTLLCPGDSLTIHIPYSSSSILWQDGSHDSIYSISNSGFFKVIVDSNGCIEKDSITVNFFTNPTKQPLSQINFCIGNDTVLNSEAGFNYLWDNGSTAQSIFISDSGIYSCSVFNQCDTVLNFYKVITQDCSCNMFVPNVFTANGDGLNDYFFPVITCIYEKYHIAIFNRWGQLLFESDNQNAKWDGTYQGNKVPEGVYFYLIDYRQPYDDKEGQRSGSITLFR